MAMKFFSLEDTDFFIIIIFFSPVSLAGTSLGSRRCEVGNILVRKKLRTIKAVT